MNKVTSKENKSFIISTWIIGVFYTFGILICNFKNLISTKCAIMIGCFFIIPLIIATIVYKNNSENFTISYIISAGFSTSYLIILLCSQLQFSTILVLPLIITLSLYLDVKRLIVPTTGCVISNIIWIFIHRKEEGFLQNAIFLLVVLSLFIFTCILVTKFAEEKAKEVEIEKQRISKINTMQKKAIDDIKNLVIILNDSSSNLYNIMDRIKTSSNTVYGAMEEIASGAEDTTENIQNQSKSIETINQKINGTLKISQKLKVNTNSNNKNLLDGLNIVNELSKTSKLIENKNSQVQDSSYKLIDSASNIKNITNMIKDIAEQINLLSLNAAIEAARAGESGKGFGVVAEEIRKLADASKNATSDISNIISDLNTEVNKSSQFVSELLQMDNKQNKLVTKTESILNIIKSDGNNISIKVDELDQSITEISYSTKKIMESIESLTAIAEETTSNAEETLTISDNFKNAADTSKECVLQLVNSAEGLKKYID